jgi:hypothetical protein
VVMGFEETTILRCPIHHPRAISLQVPPTLPNTQVAAANLHATSASAASPSELLIPSIPLFDATYVQNSNTFVHFTGGGERRS